MGGLRGGIPEMDLQAPMVGRETEFRRLARHLDAAVAGRGSLVLISGEAGIGKTRLVQELKALAASRGVHVLSGYGLFESMTPYMPFREVLRSGGLEHLFAENSPRVEAAYIVTRTGILVKAALREEARLDPDLFASMLLTVGRFVQESLSKLGGTEEPGALTRLDYGGHSILLDRGPSAYIIALVAGRENEFLARDMGEAVLRVHEAYGRVLETWDGDEERVRGIERSLAPLLSRHDGVRYGEANPQGRRNLLFENVSLGLARRAENGPILLCIEDLQWADPSTVALLHYVARNTRTCGICIIGTYRPEDLSSEGGTPHHLVDAMQRMEREDLLDVVELRRLPAPDTAKVLSSVLGGGTVPEELARRMQEDTEGNPLFIVELLNLMLEEGWLRRDNGGWSASVDVREVDVPRRVQAVIERRLGRLGDVERQILDVAATNGEEFTAAIVASALDLSSVEIQPALRALEHRHRLVRAQDDRYRFDHVKIKEVLYDGLPSEFRSRCHGLVASAMEAQYEDRLDDVAGEVAFHYYRSEDRAKAVPYLLKAAERAAKQYANAEAIRFYTEALELELDAERRWEILASLGSAYELIGEYGKALESYMSALELAAGEKRAVTLSKVARALYLKGDFEQSMKRGLEALTFVAGRNDEAEADALSQIGKVEWSRGEYAGSLEHHTKALEIRERIGDRKVIAASLNNIGIVHHYRGEYDAALEHHTKSLGIRERIGDQQGVALSLNNIGIVHAERGSYDDALEYFTRCLDQAEKMGDRQTIGIALNNIGSLQLDRGNCGPALEYHTRCLKVVQKIGDLQGIAMSLDNIGGVHAERGDFDVALEYFAKGLVLREKIRDQRGIASSLYGFGLAHRGRRDYGAALACLERGLAISRSIGARKEESKSLSLLADVELRRGEHQRAADLCDTALSVATAIGGRRTIAESRRVLGTIFRERKMWPESIENFERSVHIYQEIHHPIGQARSCYEFGLMWKEKGNPPDAVKYLAEAIEIFAKLGLERELTNARAACETITPSPGPDLRPESPPKP
ncbi:MAG TPA: BREX system ATP-binding domain-containing protein [Thermoplasmata archaeon]|nr:BREX system ATP-binding domain-containing protein [Thermoplasmata archaeon]